MAVMNSRMAVMNSWYGGKRFLIVGEGEGLRRVGLWEAELGSLRNDQ